MSFVNRKIKAFITWNFHGPEIQPQDTGYSYAAVEKLTGGSSLNIIGNADASNK